jgi:transcriptional regulator with XRE-family HTH domain
VTNAEKKLPYHSYVLKRIAHLRKKNNLTQKQVAEYLGIRQQTYSEYERGRSVMHIETLLSLARLYNVSVDYICGASNLKHEFPKY